MYIVMYYYIIQIAKEKLAPITPNLSVWVTYIVVQKSQLKIKLNHRITPKKYSMHSNESGKQV